MDSLPTIDTIDADGAIREAGEQLDTRGAFLRKSALGGGALLGSGAIMGMLPELASAKKSKKNDVKILKYALTLEYLEAAFYGEAIANNVLSGAVLETAKLIKAHEDAHVAALKVAIRGAKKKVPASPTFNFGDATKSQTAFLQTAFVLENVGVHAYLGQVGNVKQVSLLKAAGSIITIEARHAAAIAGLIGDRPYDINKGGSNYTPDGAFDTPFSKKKVLKLAGPFIVS